MRKNKASYTYTHKRILVHLLPLILLLFANCDTKLDLTSIPVDSELAGPPLVQTNTSAIAYGEEEHAISSSREGKHLDLVLSDEDKEELGPLVNRIHQETDFEQNLDGNKGFTSSSSLPVVKDQESVTVSLPTASDATSDRVSAYELPWYSPARRVPIIKGNL